MFDRLITPTLKKLVSSFPVTVLTGPRQSGKTTLLKQLFKDYRYYSLETPDTLAQVRDDPRGFLHHAKGQVIIDEAQQFPELFSYLQEYVDEHNKPGMFILSGSQNFLLIEKITQTLAGRAGILELLPLTYSELLTNREHVPNSVWDFLYQGSYPRPYHEHIDINLWYNSYIRTYLERDVRSLLSVHDLGKFQTFLKLCAGRHGQMLNMNELARDCGISQPTAEQWISVLEASYIVFRLQPYYKNFSKRMVKTPKLYFYDTAIVCQLLGIESGEHLYQHAARGAIFEGFIIAEIMKRFTAKGEQPPVYFWRDYKGHEVDLIIEKGSELYACELKSTQTVLPTHLAALRKWCGLSNSSLDQCALFYAGDKAFVQGDIIVLPWFGIDSFRLFA